MGGVASFVGDVVGDVFGGVGDVIEDVGQAIWEPIEQVGKIAESAVREVGHAVESVGREVGKIGQAAINDPVGTIAKVAAVASGQWWALPLVSAGLVIANGGDIGQAALAAGISLAAQGVAYGVTEYLGAGSAAALDMAAEDAASLAAEGLTAGQISQVLAQSYPEIGANAITQAAGLATLGTSAADIAADVGQQMVLQNLAASSAANAVGAGTRTALTGGDISDILTSAAAAGIGTGAGGATSIGLGQTGVGSTVAGAIGKGTGAAVASGIAGKDGTAAFLNSLINTTLSEAGAQTKSYLKTQWDKVTASVAEYNANLEKTNKIQEGLTGLHSEAKAAESDANAKLEAYKPLRDQYSGLVSQYDDAKAKADAKFNEYESTRNQYSSLVSQYDAAKAAGDVELANSLADRANELVPQIESKGAEVTSLRNLANSFVEKTDALIPQLNAATNAYNNAYANYETKKNAYTTQVSTFESAIKKSDELKASYQKNNEELALETKALTEAAAKVVDMPEPVQNAFAKMYQSGTNVETALQNANTLKDMSPVAQESFNRDIAKNNNTESAFEFANKINSLDTKQQASFQTGIDLGLNNTTALDVAPVISNYTKSQQLAYADAIARQASPEGADLIAAFASFGNAPEGQSSLEQDVANLAKLDNPEAKQAYRELSSKVSKDEALRTAQNLQALTGSSVIVSQESPIVGNAIPLTQKEIEERYIAQVNADVKAGKMTAAEADKELADLGISKPTSVLNVGDSTGQTGPNTGLINTGTGTGGAQLNSPNSLYTPLSFGADGAKQYYTGDGEIYSLVNINGKPTLVSDKDPENKIIIDLQSTETKIDPVTGQIVAPKAAATKAPSTTAGGNNAPAGGSPSGTSGSTGAAGAPSTGDTGTPSYTPYTITDYLSQFLGNTNTGTGAGGTTGSTTGPVSNTAGTTTGAGTGTGTTGTGTGTGTTGTGTGTGTTGTGTGAGGTGTGTGTGSGSGSGAGVGVGLGLGAAAAGTGYSGWQALQSQDQYGGIKNLTPGLTERTDYTLSGLPVDSDEETTNPMTEIKNYATGGSTAANTYDPYSTKDVSGSGVSGSLTPGLSKAQINYILTGLPGHAEGGSIEEHNPQFFSEGGLGSIDNRYVQGEGDGTSDSVPAMLANGEFVIPADVVSKLGNGSNEAGAGVLDQFLVEIRKHAHSNGEKLPPESKGPLGYLLDAKRKVKA